MTIGELLDQPGLVFAFVYALATALVVVFQLGVAAGKAWGEYTLGGRYPGRLPLVLRMAALAQAGVLGALAAIVLDTAGVGDLGWVARVGWLPWVPVIVSGVSLAMNSASSSEPEKRTWVPVTIVLLVSSLAVALLEA
ncbi:MAG TPA: hypothetical protein VGK16_06480 [Candidatus Limnocylindrales bacterium]